MKLLSEFVALPMKADEKHTLTHTIKQIQRQNQEPQQFRSENGL